MGLRPAAAAGAAEVSAWLERRGEALYVILDSPSRRNALNADAFATLQEACRLAGSEYTTALVIIGADDTFTAGGDLEWFTNLASSDPDQLRTVFAEFAAMMWAMEDLPCPIVAGVSGACVAGGLEIVCLADIVVAARGATFADGHARVGLLPLAGSVHRLVARVGSATANRLLLAGAVIDADEALRIGLVGDVVDNARLPAALEDTCAALAARPAPVVAALTRLSRQVDENRIRARRRELDEALANAARPDVLEGLHAFQERRNPRFGTTTQPPAASTRRQQ